MQNRGFPPVKSKLGRAAVAQRLHTAVSSIPKDDTVWRKQRDEWKAALSRSSAQTSSTKLVGLTIADRTINRSPGHKNFRLGWASVDKLAEWTALSPRTISTAFAELESAGWIALKRGTGPGNSSKYTLCLDRRLVSERDANDPNYSMDPIAKQEYLKNLQESAGAPVAKSSNPENFGRDTGKMPWPNKQDLRPNPTSTPIRLLRERATAQDHLQLATVLGEGNIERGYELMGKASADQLERVAVNLRERNLTADQIRAALSQKSAPAENRSEWGTKLGGICQ